MFNSNQRATAFPQMFGALDAVLADRKFLAGAFVFGRWRWFWADALAARAGICLLLPPPPFPDRPLWVSMRSSSPPPGDKFTVSDVAVGAYIAYCEIFFQLNFSQYKQVTRYMNDIRGRPAFQSTIGTEYN